VHLPSEQAFYDLSSEEVNLPVPVAAAGVALTGHALRIGATYVARKQMTRVTATLVKRLAVQGIPKRHTMAVARDMARMFPSSTATTLEATGLIAQAAGGAGMITWALHGNPQAVRVIGNLVGTVPEGLSRINRRRR
jgi:hypothetical protein